MLATRISAVLRLALCYVAQSNGKAPSDVEANAENASQCIPMLSVRYEFCGCDDASYLMDPRETDRAEISATCLYSRSSMPVEYVIELADIFLFYLVCFVGWRVGVSSKFFIVTLSDHSKTSVSDNAETTMIRWRHEPSWSLYSKQIQ